MYRLLMIALIASIAGTVFVGVLLFMFDPNDAGAAKAFFSLLLMVLAFGALTAAQTARRRGRMPLFMLISMLATVLGAIGLLAMVWADETLAQDYRLRERFWFIAGSFMTIGLAFAHTGAFSLVPARTVVLTMLKVVVMLCVWLFASFLLTMFWLQPYLTPMSGNMGLFFTLLAAAMIIAGVGLIGTIAVPVAAASRANRTDPPIESVRSSTRVTLECPRCRSRQELAAGNSRCGSCGAGIFIEVEEPRCECGYLLYKLQGDTCPECGRPVQVMAPC